MSTEIDEARAEIARLKSELDDLRSGQFSLDYPLWVVVDDNRPDGLVDIYDDNMCVATNLPKTGAEQIVSEHNNIVRAAIRAEQRVKELEARLSGQPGNPVNDSAT